MPTIKFKLKDPKYCKKGLSWCPCANFHAPNLKCDFGDIAQEVTSAFCNIKRPQSCIEKYGE